MWENRENVEGKRFIYGFDSFPLILAYTCEPTAWAGSNNRNRFDSDQPCWESPPGQAVQLRQLE
jgi:hypothetical protein